MYEIIMCVIQIITKNFTIGNITSVKQIAELFFLQSIQLYLIILCHF